MSRNSTELSKNSEEIFQLLHDLANTLTAIQAEAEVSLLQYQSQPDASILLQALQSILDEAKKSSSHLREFYKK